ncbi:MAG: radical SAM protein [Spirochaetes bacterium]|nr:radical SAM protein [Spirochaetota bacterium]
MKKPSYFKILENGTLDKRIEEAYDILTHCCLCPNNCGVDRRKEEGNCRSRITPMISSFNPHHGEEPPISGISGSGTIFFTNCTLHCCFCQNYPISQMGTGSKRTVEELADMYLYLQAKHCHNINFVTPTHFVPQILKALKIAVSRGFNLPLVYNSSGYDSLKTLKLLDGVIDIYLPDMKYGSNENGLQYSKVQNYSDHNRIAIKEMFSQVGALETTRDGVAVKGLIIRHLVLPYNISKSKEILKFLKEEVGTEMTLSIMAQYFPAYKAVDDKRLKFKITPQEYKVIIDHALTLGFKNILGQEI